MANCGALEYSVCNTHIYCSLHSLLGTLQAEGRGFESLSSHDKRQRQIFICRFFLCFAGRENTFPPASHQFASLRSHVVCALRCLAVICRYRLLRRLCAVSNFQGGNFALQGVEEAGGVGAVHLGVVELE